MNELKNLNINPLSVAKYFYEKGIDDNAIIQRLIYLTYLEILKKEGVLLFEEEWQAWSGGPVIEGLFYAMKEHREKYGDYQKLFTSIPYLTDEKITSCCEEWINYYWECEKNKDHCKLVEKTKTKPWELARRNLTNWLESRKIELADIVNFVQLEKEKNYVF